MAREKTEETLPEVVEEVLEEVAEVEETEETEETEIPAWMAEEDETDLDSSEDEEDGEVKDGVPVATLVSIKKKLKGKISDRDTEIEDLKRQLAEKNQQESAPPQNLDLPKRPKANDYDTNEEHENAMEDYDRQMFAAQTQHVQNSSSQNRKLKQREQEIAEAIDGHYDRSAKLVQDNSLNPEVVRKAEESVKAVIENVFGGQRLPYVFNDIVEAIGDGSEKVLFHIGRNKSKQLELEALLKRNDGGLKAVAYLNRLAEQVSRTTKQSSRAPKPSAQINGDATSNAKEAALKKKWDASHKKGDINGARKFKKQARLNGADTTNWR